MGRLDIAPTLLELAGIPAPKQFEGRSFVKLATAGDSEWRKEWLYEYFEYPAGEGVRPHRMIRTEIRKFVHYYTDPQEYELYDLTKDPQERNNLAGKPEFAALQRDLAGRLEKLRGAANVSALNRTDHIAEAGSNRQ